MPTIRCIEQSCESFIVLAIHPFFDLQILIFLIDLSLLCLQLTSKSFSCLFNKESDDIEMPFVGKLMQDSILLIIGKSNNVEIGVLV